ncbi:hypothetical protein D9758_012530 [Tetrapyrgos nigripes]|uniref:Uncharacterized protein n=1 Tax=Tetrapyrgos nigripes TaxID=182062 RepID=A0A8H5LHC2_9AGAR|nr:hypothetical protein D9758_012530 [Tetrapyrgos nigripes]
MSFQHCPIMFLFASPFTALFYYKTYNFNRRSEAGSGSMELGASSELIFQRKTCRDRHGLQLYDTRAATPHKSNS